MRILLTESERAEIAAALAQYDAMPNGEEKWAAEWRVHRVALELMPQAINEYANHEASVHILRALLAHAEVEDEGGIATPEAARALADAILADLAVDVPDQPFNLPPPNVLTVRHFDSAQPDGIRTESIRVP